MKRKRSSQKFIIEIYNLRFFFFYVKKISSPTSNGYFLPGYVYVDKKNSQLNEDNFSYVIRSSWLFRGKKKKKSTEPVSVTTPVISKTIDLAPKPSKR